MSDLASELFYGIFEVWSEILIETGLMNWLIGIIVVFFIVTIVLAIAYALWYLHQKEQNKQYHHALFMHELNNRRNR